MAFGDPLRKARQLREVSDGCNAAKIKTGIRGSGFYEA